MISISIIIPAYNVEPFITRCLDSIDSQDYQGNMECIVVDDCSTDESLNIINKYKESHTNSKVKYKIIHHKKNKGVSVARNNALNIATGDYIYFVDGDDYLHPNALSLLAAQVEQHPGIDMVMGYFCDDCNQIYRDIDIYKRQQFINNPEWIQYAFLRLDGEFNITSTDKLTRREFLIEKNISFPPGIVIHEDNHWLYQVLTKIKTFALIFEKTYIRYINPDSATHTINKQNERENWYRIIYDYSKNIQKPLRKLKLGRFMHKYFFERLYELGFPNDLTIRFNFMKTSILCGEIRVAVFLLATLLFPKYCWRKNININLELHSYRMFSDESNKHKTLLDN